MLVASIGPCFNSSTSKYILLMQSAVNFVNVKVMTN
jgi:hypothetical protein